MKPVIIIQGPTAVGKSSLALDIAEKLNSEIISADSRQIYRYMDLGTAKPTAEDTSRVKHNLIDIIDPNESFSAGNFAVECTKLVDHSNLEFPVIAGGTGFYIASFLEGLCDVETIPGEVRAKFELEFDQKGNIEMYKKLTLIDSVVANKISVKDRQRIIRALEVYDYTGKKLSQFWEEQGLLVPRKVMNIVLVDDREDIYDRINRRYDEMVKLGLLEEIRQLLAMGYQESDPGMTAVGYKELLPHILRGESLEKGIELAKQHSRNYAKRQLTWYRRCKLDFVFFRKSIRYNDIYSYVETFIKDSVS